MLNYLVSLKESAKIFGLEHNFIFQLDFDSKHLKNNQDKKNAIWPRGHLSKQILLNY